MARFSGIAVPAHAGVNRACTAPCHWTVVMPSAALSTGGTWRKYPKSTKAQVAGSYFPREPFR
jgi:hypothetical protein